MSDRSIEELAKAAVDASQSSERTLHVRPGEYAILCVHHWYDRYHVDGWDPLVFEEAKRRGLPTPLPDVKVVIV